jgi:hypothetical protein
MLSIDLPDYMKLIAGNSRPATAAEVATKNVLDLDLAMMGLYDNAISKYQKTFLAQHPVILALFTHEGGKLTLYRPGNEPLEAPSVPVRYQVYKSVGHSSMAVFELAASNLGTVADRSWEAPMRAFRAANQSAVDGLGAVELSDEDRDNQAHILRRNIEFMDACLDAGDYTFADIERYARGLKPYLKKNIEWAATTQVDHRMAVAKDWKEMPGADRDRTYGATNTLYVTRQNNILFSILAQFFGKEAINTRLFLFETPAFVTTPGQMLDVLIRTVSDRSVGQVFFGNYYVMDYELMGGDAWKAIQAGDEKYAIPEVLPPLVPFHSNEWPFRTDPGQGEGPATIEEIKTGE